MARNKRGQSLLSQQKYNEAHPVISLRLPVELRDRLRAHLKEQSFAEFVESHLVDEETRVNARVEELMRQDQELEAKVARSSRRVAELDAEIEKKKRELEKPFEEERARKQAEINSWFRGAREAFEYTQAAYEKSLEPLRSEIEKEKEKLRGVKMDIVFAEMRHRSLDGVRTSFEQERKQWHKEVEIWKKEMHDLSKRVNTFPWLSCNQCPGAFYKQVVKSMLDTLFPPRQTFVLGDGINGA